jgi:phenylpropionate dioxygenase-like ring-hydroxylating dioxygenase large terminal subunit
VVAVLAADRERVTRLLRVVESGRNEGAAPSTAEAWEYVEPARYAREAAALRRRALPVAASSAVAPGTHLVTERLGVSLIVSRDLDGRVHVLKNRCRHRGAALSEHRACTAAQRLVCPYHGWSYGLDGRLLHVPEREQGFPTLTDEEGALHRVPCAEWAGTIWIGGEGEAAPESCLAPLREEPELARLAPLRAFDCRRWIGEFNWKLGVNGFLETYHFKVAHKTGIAPHFLWNRMLVDPLGEHLRLTLPRSTIARPDALPLESWGDAELRSQVSLVYFLFPCTFISILPDHASFITFVPDGPSRTQVESHVLVPEGADTTDAYWEKNAALFRQTITEDNALSASIQRGIAAEPTDTFTFATFEQGIAHFRAALDRLVGT